MITDLKENEGDQIGPSSACLRCYSPAAQTKRVPVTRSRGRVSLRNRFFCFHAPGQTQRLAALLRPVHYHANAIVLRSCHDENVEPVRRRLASCELRWFPSAGHFPWVKTPRSAARVIRAPALILFRPSTTHQFARSLSRPRHRFLPPGQAAGPDRARAAG